MLGEAGRVGAHGSRALGDMHLPRLFQTGIRALRFHGPCLALVPMSQQLGEVPVFAISYCAFLYRLLHGCVYESPGSYGSGMSVRLLR